MAKSKSNKTFHVRIVHEDFRNSNDERTTIYSARFIQRNGTNLIRVQNLVKKGDYEVLLLGMSLNSLCQWQRSRGWPGSYPMNCYNEIFDEEKDVWVRELRLSELMEMALFR
jgi:hypothetical protein